MWNKTRILAVLLLIGVSFCTVLGAQDDKNQVERQSLRESDSEVKPQLKNSTLVKKDSNVFHQADIRDANTGEIIVPDHFYSPRNLPKIKRKFYRLKPFKELKLTCNATFPVEWQMMEVGDGDQPVEEFKNFRYSKSFSSVTMITPDDLEETDKGYSSAVFHCVGKKANKKSKITMRLYFFKK